MRLNLPAGPSCKFVRLDQRPDRLDTEWQQGCDPLGSRSRRTCERKKNIILQFNRCANRLMLSYFHIFYVTMTLVESTEWIWFLRK